MNAEKMCKQHEAQLAEFQSRMDEQQRAISELNSHKSRMSQEGSELSHQLEEAESQLGSLNKVSQKLQAYSYIKVFTGDPVAS